jgi:hypothetical protein
MTPCRCCLSRNIEILWGTANHTGNWSKQNTVFPGTSMALKILHYSPAVNFVESKPSKFQKCGESSKQNVPDFRPVRMRHCSATPPKKVLPPFAGQKKKSPRLNAYSPATRKMMAVWGAFACRISCRSRWRRCARQRDLPRD